MALSPVGRTLLLTGATGFVGRAVRPALEAAGYRVRGLTRDAQRASARHPGLEWVQADVSDEAACARALRGCDAALYLVHGMGEGADYHRREVEAASRFARAAGAAGVRRVVYLGGVTPAGEGASEHLQSRRDVGAALRAGPVPTVELRASMIVGHGSLSWLIVRDLAARLPFMVLPRWMGSRTEPVAIDDVVVALVRALDMPLDASACFDIPGPEVLSGRAILEQSASVMGLPRPLTLEVPLLSPRLSSHWVRFVTRAEWAVARELVVGLREDLLAADASFWERIAHPRRVPFAEAAAQALAAESSEGPLPGPWGVIERVRRGVPQPGLARTFVLLWLGAALATHAVGIWPAFGTAALLLGAVTLLLDPEAKPSLRPRAAQVALGVVAGGVMTAATHLLYPLATRLWPFLADDAAALYTAFRAVPPLVATLALLPVILGEELVWRGAVQGSLARRHGVWVGAALAALVYALAHAPLGSPVLVLAALSCGLAWGGLRAAAGSLVPALVSHIVWDLGVLLFFPLDVR